MFSSPALNIVSSYSAYSPLRIDKKKVAVPVRLPFPFQEKIHGEVMFPLRIHREPSGQTRKVCKAHRAI